MRGVCVLMLSFMLFLIRREGFKWSSSFIFSAFPLYSFVFYVNKWEGFERCVLVLSFMFLIRSF